MNEAWSQVGLVSDGKLVSTHARYRTGEWAYAERDGEIVQVWTKQRVQVFIQDEDILPGSEIVVAIGDDETLEGLLDRVPHAKRVTKVGPYDTEELPMGLIGKWRFDHARALAEMSVDNLVELLDHWHGELDDPADPDEILAFLREVTSYDDVEEYVECSGAFELPDALKSAIRWSEVDAEELLGEHMSSDEFLITELGTIYTR
jgi:hypothetical protein